MWKYSPTLEKGQVTRKKRKREESQKGKFEERSAVDLKEMIPKSFLQQLSSFSTADVGKNTWTIILHPDGAIAMEKVEDLMQEVKLLKDRLATARELIADQALESKEGKRKAYDKVYEDCKAKKPKQM